MRARFETRLVKATVFRAASIERLKDAQCLHDAGRFHGAIYLCGYALECELKYRICRARRIESMVELEAKRLGHRLAELLRLAGLANLILRNRELSVAFQAVNEGWSTEIRYSGIGRNRRDSEEFLKDSRALLLWLRAA